MAARLGWRASVITVITCGVVAASAAAQTVPLPKPDPRSKPGLATAGAIQSSPPEAAAPAAPASRGFFPFSFSLDKSAVAKASAFDAKQRALLDKVSRYLSSVQTIVGRFVQVGPD